MKAVVIGKRASHHPKRLREGLGIRPGEVLIFREERGQLAAVKESKEDPVQKVYGILKPPTPTDELITRLRGPSPKK